MLVLVFALIGSVLGCGPSCRSSCEQLYGSTQNVDGTTQCDINVAGYSGQEGANRIITECEAECDNAMKETGPLGNYDPNSNADTEVELANEKQAAKWMDCVADTSCDNLMKGYCQPHL